MKKYYTTTAVALLVSLFIYIVYRSEQTVVNILLDQLTGHRAFLWKQQVRHLLPLPGYIIFSVPEGLWIFAATLISKNLYLVYRHRKFHLVHVPILYGIGLEFLQLLHIMPGRFDILDILFTLFFWLLAMLFISNPFRQQSIREQFNYRTFLLLFAYGIVFLSHVSL